MTDILNETQPKGKRTFPRWRRILLILVITAMGLLTILMLTSFWMGRQLGAEITNISTAGEPITFSDLATEPDPCLVSINEDAARYYIEAFLSVRPPNLEDLMQINTFYRKSIISLPANQLSSDLRERITQNLSRFQPVFEKSDKGANLPLAYFVFSMNRGIRVYKTYLPQVQTVAFMLSLRTLDLILNKQSDAAAGSAISMLQMVRIFDSHPTMVLHTAKTGFVNLACEDIRTLLEIGHPSEKSLARLQEALSQVISDNVLEKSFLAERVYQIEVARNLIPASIVSRFLPKQAPDLPERIPSPRSLLTKLRIRKKVTSYFHDMARLISLARQPWPTLLDSTGGDRLNLEQKPKTILEMAALVTRLTADTLVAVRCTMLAISIERYHLAKGEPPRSLDDLSPTYINSVPLDPFTGKKLLYHHDKETYVVYSTGVNRQDDNGSITPKDEEKIAKDQGLCIHFNKIKSF